MPFRTSTQAAAAAHKSWAKTKDRSGRTAPGREAALQKLLDEVDPDHEMSESDRLKAAENLRKARLYDAAQKSVDQRALRKKALEDAKRELPRRQDGASA